MAYYYSASNRAFYCTEIVSVDVMPADKVAVSDEAYKSLMAAQNAGKLIRPGAGGVPEAVDQPGGAATGITHEVTAATADTLGHVKIGSGVNVTQDGTISVDTEVLFRQDSWSTRIASTLYAVGDIVDCPYKRNLELICTQAGTTGSGDIAEGGLTHGATVADGSVKWKVRAKIKTVNGGEPNASGEIDVDVGVKTVNGKGPDEAGNVNVDISSKRDHTIQVANADLNTLLDDKTWACSGTLKNTPIACTFCIVQAYDTGAPISGNIVQVCYIPNQTDNTVRTFTRNCLNGSTFGKWTESGAVKTVNNVAPDASGEVTLPNATTSKYGLVRLAAEEDVLNEAPQTAVCTQLIYEINEFRRKSTVYNVGDKVDCAFQYDRFLECSKAGTTSGELLDTRNVTHGQIIPDGTAEWTVRTHVRSINSFVADANGNISSTQTGCLPLIGGTMTGPIELLPQKGGGHVASAYVPNSEDELIFTTGDPDFVNSGGHLSLYGRTAPFNSGGFCLSAKAETDKTLSLLGGTDGTLTWVGEQIATRHIPVYDPSVAKSQPVNSELCVIRSDVNSAPNNGVILSYGNSGSWVGQLYISDNTEQGIFVRGASDGVWSEWKRLHDENTFINGGGIGLAKGAQRASVHGLLVCYAYSSGWGGGEIYVNGSNMGSQFGKECGGAMYAIVKKGDEINLTTNNATSWWATLYPFRKD